MVVHLFKRYLGCIFVNLAPGFYMEIFYRLSSLFALESFFFFAMYGLQRGISISWDMFIFIRIESKIAKTKIQVVQNILFYAVYFVICISRFEVLCASQKGGLSESVMHTLRSPTRDLGKCM